MKQNETKQNEIQRDTPVCLVEFRFISFHFISFRFILFHFVSFCFISFHFISFCFILFHFVSFHFISFHFISFRFISFHFISFHFISLMQILNSNFIIKNLVDKPYRLSVLKPNNWTVNLKIILKLFFVEKNGAFLSVQKWETNKNGREREGGKEVLVRVCVRRRERVCVWESERERERENKKMSG